MLIMSKRRLGSLNREDIECSSRTRKNRGAKRSLGSSHQKDCWLVSLSLHCCGKRNSRDRAQIRLRLSRELTGRLSPSSRSNQTEPRTTSCSTSNWLATPEQREHDVVVSQLEWEVTDEGDCGDGSGCGNGRGEAGGAARAAGGYKRRRCSDSCVGIHRG